VAGIDHESSIRAFVITAEGTTNFSVGMKLGSPDALDGHVTCSRHRAPTPSNGDDASMLGQEQTDIKVTSSRS
jgi:enoyl-CoA hydratase/carnithine racemase